MPRRVPTPVVPKPTGRTKAKGSATTTGTYATVAELTVAEGKTFHLAKIVVSCNQDAMAKVRWAGADVSVEYLVSGKLPFTDWFPYDWHPMVGDGTKKVDIQAKYPTGGTAGDLYAELVGEEV